MYCNETIFVAERVFIEDELGFTLLDFSSKTMCLDR